MGLQVACPSCGKTYNADETLIGRRIKCRQCSAVFVITDPNAEQEAFSAAPNLAELDAGETQQSMPMGNPAQFQTPPTYNDDVVVESLSSGRRNVRLTYPYAAVVDRWLPVFLVVGGLAWLIFAAAHFDETGTAWLVVARVAVLILVYVGLIYPMALKGLKMAGRDVGFQLPMTHKWRAVATFMPAFTLAGVLWMMSGGWTGLILGLVFGMLISSGVMWLLFRLRSNELPAAAGYAGGMMVFAVAIAGGILFGLNLLLSNVLVATHKSDGVPGSPFGVAFAWPKPAQIISPNKPILVAKAPTSPTPAEPATPSTAPAGDAIVNANQTDAPPTPTPTLKTDPFATDTPPSDGKTHIFDGTPGDPANATTENAHNNPTIASNVPPPTKGPEGPGSAIVPVPTIAPAPKTSSPLVDSLTMAPLDGPFDQIILPQTPSSWAALLRKGEGRGMIDRVWIGPGDPPPAGGSAVKAWGVTASAPYVPETQAAEKYALSPDGELLAHVSSFPSLSVPIFSFKQNRIVQTIKLVETFGEADVVGFAGNDHLLVHRQKSNLDGFELWDVKTNARIKAFDVAHFESANSLAIAPDGTMLAIAGQDSGHPTIFTYELNVGGNRKLAIADLNNASAPTGLAFNSDGSRIAALYEQAPNGLLVIFRTRSMIKPLLSQPLIPMPASGGKTFTGSSLQWASDDALIVYGQSILASATGAPLGQLDIADPLWQRFVKPDLCELGQTGQQGEREIALVKLKMSEISKGKGK